MLCRKQNENKLSIVLQDNQLKISNYSNNQNIFNLAKGFKYQECFTLYSQNPVGKSSAANSKHHLGTHC